jgi:phosphoglucomutase
MYIMETTDKTSRSYSSNGAQINRPEDGEIAQSIQENLEPWPTAWTELQPGEFLRADSYQKLLPHYSSQVAKYTVRCGLRFKDQSDEFTLEIHGG